MTTELPPDEPFDPLLAKVARAPAIPTSEPIGQTIADRYRVLGLLGHGGMGRVYEAEDVELGRRVALKFLRAPAGGRPEALERFLRERTLTAKLEHPAIIPVYDAGVTAAGEPFYVMRVAGGEPLDRLVEKADTVEARLALIPIVIAVAEAVAFAHSRGIVHRDLKPANVLVGAFGETLVADWGIAKRVGGAAEAGPAAAQLTSGSMETRAGTVLGTPAYMAPEQAAGGAVDERGDVYALGATLHHVVSGVPPDGGEAALAGVPADVIAIIRKALARDPAARYQKAAELAGELRRFQTGQMVAARRYTRGERLRRWARRRRSELILGGALGAILVAVSITGVARIVAERNAIEARNREMILLQTRAEMTRDPTASLAWLKRYPRDAAGWDTATALAADAASRGVARAVWDLGRPIGSVAFSPDGGTIAAGAKDGTLTLIDRESGARRVLRAEDGVGDRVIFSPDGARLATSDGVDAVRLWDRAAGTSIRVEGERAGGPNLWFSPDGAILLARHPGAAMRLWRVPSGEPLSIPDETGALYAFLPGAIAVAKRGSLALVDASTLRPIAETRVEGGPPRDLVASRDGGWVAVAQEGAVVAWTPRTGAMTRITAAPGTINLLSAWERGPRLMGCSTFFGGGNDVWTFDVVAGTAQRLSSDERCARQAFTFSPDGTTAVTVGFGSELRLHETGERRVTALLGHEGAVADAAFSADGEWLVSASSDHTVRLWRLGEGDLRTLRDVNLLDRIAETGEVLISDERDGSVFLVDVRSGRRRELAGPRPDALRGKGTLSLDGTTAAFPMPGSFVVWNLRAGTARTLPVELSDDLVASMRRDGGALAQIDGGGEVRVVDLATGGVRVLARLRDAGFALDWSADGRRIAAGGRGGTARVYEVGSGAELARLPVPGWVWYVSFSPDGTRLAVACADGNLRILDLASGAATTLEGHIGMAMSAEFTADGRRLISAGTDGTVRLWDLATGRARVIVREPAAISLASLAPDGRTLLVRSFFKARFWDLAAMPPLDADPAAVTAWIEGRTSAEVDGRGSLRTP